MQAPSIVQFNITQTSMELKWKVYLIALFSYSTIHAIRTMWSTIKSDLTIPPFNYQVSFLGTLDMVVLFVSAIFMNILGPKIQSWGVKRTLITAMISLSVLTLIIGCLLDLAFTSAWLYVIFFAFGVGLLSSVGWPSCLCMVSYFFDKKNGIALSAYNGSSQFGDFTSLITYYAIVKLSNWQPQSSFFLITFYLLFYVCLIKIFIPNELAQQKQPNNQNLIELHEQKPVQKLQKAEQQCNQEIKEEINVVNSQKKEGETKQEGVNHEINPEIPNDSQVNEEMKITMLMVWQLPGVALNVLAYGFIKAVNSFIVGWLVYYLLQLDMGSESVLITISWSASVFAGGIASALFNKTYSKPIFILQLFVSLICFIFLQEFHNKIYQAEIIFCLIVCAFFYGGPYNLMSTAIPIILGSQPQIEKYSNGKGAVISLMEGYGQFFCGFSLLLVPLFDVKNINAAGATYCGFALLLLFIQAVRERKPLWFQRQRRNSTDSKKQNLAIP